jgi:Cu/Zn superoxide dismutase
MRISRLAIALATVACAVALPAVAAAHKGHGSNHGHHGKGDNGAVVRLSPVSGQKAKGAASFTQHTGALSVELVVSRLTPGAFYAAHIHTGSCATPTGPIALTLPDIYADEDGVAKLVTTLPTSTDFLAGGYYVDVHAGATGGDATVISCGDIKVKTPKASSHAHLKGAGDARGRAELIQKGSDVSAWIKVSGLTPGAHAVQIHAGSCDALGTLAVTLGDVTADVNGDGFAKLTATSAAVVVGKYFTVDVNANPRATAGATVVACGDQHSDRSKHGHQ